MGFGDAGLRPNTDTRFLLRFLRARKFDQEQAFDMILKYYRMKKQDARMYTGLKPLNVLHVYPTSVAFPLPFRDRLGRQVYITYSGLYWCCLVAMTGLNR